MEEADPKDLFASEPERSRDLKKGNEGFLSFRGATKKSFTSIRKGASFFFEILKGKTL
jgi:hypothetical protein